MNAGISSDSGSAALARPELLARLQAVPHRLGELEVKISGIWAEDAVSSGIIAEFPGHASAWPEMTPDVVLSHHHFCVGNPLFQCPDNPCTGPLQWHSPDLTAIPADYLPRHCFHSVTSGIEYLGRMDYFQGRPVIRFFRLGLRKAAAAGGLRTLMACILSQGVAHTGTVVSICFRDENQLLRAAGMLAALPLDFYARSQHRASFDPEFLKDLPLPELPGSLSAALCARTLCLNCLTVWYNGLWERCFREEFCRQRWSRSGPGLNSGFFAGLKPDWNCGCALRGDLERRQALLELDVIAAKALGFRLEDLLEIYCSGFAEFRAFEQAAWYDQQGRMICSGDPRLLRGLPQGRAPSCHGVRWAVDGREKPEGLSFEEVRDLPAGEVSATFNDCTLPGSPARRICWQAPFFRCDREEDYRRAWEFFPEV